MPNNDYEDDIISLTSSTGEEIEFVHIANIFYDTELYAILQPVELLDGMDEDEALVFKVNYLEDDETSYSIVTDDEIIDNVFKKYNELLDEELKKQ